MNYIKNILQIVGYECHGFIQKKYGWLIFSIFPAIVFAAISAFYPDISIWPVLAYIFLSGYNFYYSLRFIRLKNEQFISAFLCSNGLLCKYAIAISISVFIYTALGACIYCLILFIMGYAFPTIFVLLFITIYVPTIMAAQSLNVFYIANFDIDKLPRFIGFFGSILLILSFYKKLYFVNAINPVAQFAFFIQYHSGMPISLEIGANISVYTLYAVYIALTGCLALTGIYGFFRYNISIK